MKQKFYCSERDRQVTKDDCVPCSKWDECMDRPQGEGIATALVIAFVVLAIGLIILLTTT